MTKLLDALNHFMGYGNPAADYWFIGLDEQGSFDIYKEEMELEKLKIYSEHYKDFPFHLSNENFKSFYEKYPEQLLNVDKDSTYSGIGEIYKILPI